MFIRGQVHLKIFYPLHSAQQSLSPPVQMESTNLLSPFSDLRVRYGIKLSLASLLSLYVALVLRLEHPNWAVLTALVMMNSHYVGSTAVKAMLRCIGTIGGALL